MVFDLVEGESLGGIIGEDVRNEVSGFGRHELGELQVYFLYSIIGCLVVLCLEGRVAHEELVAQDAQAPDVDFVVVGEVIDHLGGQVVKSAAEGLPPVIGGVDAPPEVSYLDSTL